MLPTFVLFYCNNYIAMYRPQSNMLKNCPKCFWNIPKFFTYYALHIFHYACIMLQYEQH